MSGIKIVITGGPSGGKTTLVDALQKDFAGKVAIVPEAASILYRGGFPRKSTPIGKRHAQRAICFVQRELEDLTTDENKAQVIVCDRGSLDSIAYWPDTPEDLFKNLNTTRAAELSRYQWVIHLDTADMASFDTTNPVRTENYKEALKLNGEIKKAWEGHPHRIVITHSSEFLEKIGKARNAIKMILAGESYDTILKAIEK